MIASLLLTTFFCLLIFFRYKQGIIISAMTIQLLSYIGTGIPGVKIYFSLSIFALLLLFPKLKYLSRKPYGKWLRRASILFLLSFGATLSFTHFSHWDKVLINYIAYFIFPFILWKCLDSKKNVQLAIKTLAIFMSVAVVYGVFEAFSRSNPVFELLEKVFVMEDFTINTNVVRFGLKRCNSFFAYNSTYGIACFASIFVFYTEYFLLRQKNRWHIALMFLCVFGTLSTGSRAVFPAMGVTLLCLFLSKRFMSTKAGVLFFVTMVVFLPLLTTILYQMIDSMVNSSTSEYARGSSLKMRTWQWKICYPYFMDSPIVGNGRMFIWDVVKKAHSKLLGAESIWFSILVDYGLLGASAFLYLIYACARHLKRYNFRLICLPIGYLLILSLSPDTGITYNVLISFTVLIIRMFQFLNKNSYEPEVQCNNPDIQHKRLPCSMY